MPESQGQAGKLRERKPIIEFRDKFCPQFIRKVYPIIKWEKKLKGKLLLLVNILDRTSEESIKTRKIIYAGILEQRSYFTDDPIERLDEDWRKLYDGQFDIYESDIVKKLFGEVYIEKEQFRFSDIKVESLKQYFDQAEEGIFRNKYQSHEYAIIKEHFSIEKDAFVSIPVVQFGFIDGLVHVVFSEEDAPKFSKQEHWEQLIRRFSEAYEDMILDWDVVGENINKLSLIEENLEYIRSPAWIKFAENNSILKDLDYQIYYEVATSYFRERIRQNDEIPKAIKNEHRKRAIISILIDSYAHNISAHSLTVLKWWFQQRAAIIMSEEGYDEIVDDEMPIEKWGDVLVPYLLEKSLENYPKEEIEDGLQKELKRWLAHLRYPREDNGLIRAVRDQFYPLAQQMTPLFKFLLEKGAFWSGVTRDQQFGGEIRDLYSVLWYDFIENPLYLGTIAYSEKITRLNIHIRIYKWEHIALDKKHPFERTYTLDQSETGELLSGRLASVDVGGAANRLMQHDFIERGEKHELFKEKLSQCKIFFPGGVVGKHAFFTLIENEIRNVKHYPEEALMDMEKNGLDLVISIRPKNITSKLEYTAQALYKIGIWLDHPTELMPKEKKLTGDGKNLVVERMARLMEDIITPETSEARLGGTYQDKICAAMLFNNTFVSVERRSSKRDNHYYPWVRSAISPGPKKDKEVDFEVNQQNFEDAEAALTYYPNRETGYFKKYVHLWKGEFLYHLEDAQKLAIENVARFTIVNIAQRSKEVIAQLRSADVIRIVEGLPIEIADEKAYQYWLKSWLKKDQFGIAMHQGKTPVGFIIFTKDDTGYYSKAAYRSKIKELGSVATNLSFQNLHFRHSKNSELSSDTLSIRSHGVLREKFFPMIESVEDFTKAELSGKLLYEFIEAIMTRICIFDKRVADRVNPERSNLLRDQALCSIFSESLGKWKEVKDQGIKNFHFIVMHLSFIEAMKDARGERYGEDRIVAFIEDQLADALSPNCLLVITTGRGRTRWWQKIQRSRFANYVTFRPVESLIEATEKATLKKDEIELKYNLCKVLFGS